MLKSEQMKTLKEKLATLSGKEKDALLAKIKTHLNAKNSCLDDQILSPHPLTSAQQRLWTLEKFDRVSYLYHVPFVLSLNGAINDHRLQQAIEILITQHSQLASYFSEKEDTVNQLYADKLALQIIKIDLNDELPAVFKLNAQHPLADFFLKPFNLNEPPLFRVALAKAKSAQYLLICCHHLLMDAWSAELLMHQLSFLYTQLSRNNYSVNKVDISKNNYREYTTWEQNQLTTQGYHAELTYWENNLKTRSWHIDLMTDYQRPPYLSGRGDNYYFSMPDICHQKLIDYAKKNQVSVNHVILSVFQLLLGRYSGQDDILLGMPIAGRQQQAWQKTIGLFVNTCIHAKRLNYQISFKEHLQNTKLQLLQDIAHSILPYDYLIKHFYDHQWCEHGITFNILYNFIQTNNQNDFYFDQSRANPILCLLPSSKFDISLHVMASAKSLTYIAEYSTDLFCEATIQQLLNDLVHYINSAIANDELSLRELVWVLNN